jgi:hypothetical protein
VTTTDGSDALLPDPRPGVDLYDTTLRDGTQREGISLSVEDKLRVARAMDDLGVTYIEGGWPGANPKDTEFFARAADGELQLDSATLVAFGTSLPELVTAVTAARRGHGELAIGNIVGADILNVLFVSGAAAAATEGGLIADPHFFIVLFPVMLFVLAVFRIGIFVSGDAMRRPFGYVLLGAYGLYLAISLLFPDLTP